MQSYGGSTICSILQPIVPSACLVTFLYGKQPLLRKKNLYHCVLSLNFTLISCIFKKFSWTSPYFMVPFYLNENASMRARASKHLYKFCEQFEIQWDHPIPLMLAWQQHRCHSVAFFMHISRAKFEEHCCNISGDILDSKKKRKTSLSNISSQVPFPCMQISHYINNC